MLRHGQTSFDKMTDTTPQQNTAYAAYRAHANLCRAVFRRLDAILTSVCKTHPWKTCFTAMRCIVHILIIQSYIPTLS